MPVVQIDWTSIKALFGDVTEFIALTSRQRALLLSLTEQLTWRKTFDDFGYDWADKDTLDLEIADLERNLTMPVVLSDLIGYIDEIEDLLRALKSTANCCGPVDVTDGDQYTDPVEDGTGDVPQNIIDAGYATGTSDWEGFYDYKCMISHVMVDDMEYSLRAIHERFDDTGVIIGGVGTIAAIIGSILAAVASGGITLLLEAIAALGAASAVWGGITELGDVAVESLADKVNTYHDALACAIYFSDGTFDAMDELQAAIDTYFTAAEAIILKNMNLGPKLKGLYAGRYDQQDIAQNMADNGFDPADYDCSCYTAGAELALFEFTAGVEGWEVVPTVATPWEAGGYMDLRYSEGALYVVANTVHNKAGLGDQSTSDPIHITRLAFDGWSPNDPIGPTHIRVTIGQDGDAVVYDLETIQTSAWEGYEIKPFPPIPVPYNKKAVQIDTVGGTSHGLYFDNVEVEFDT